MGVERRVSDGAPAAANGASGVLFGREAELARVDATLARLRAGQGGALLFSGEAGIGKTRLAHEAARRAAALGCQTLTGRGYPLQAELAYAPLVEALGRALRSREPLRRAPLLHGLPELGRLFAGLGLPVPVAGDPAIERMRLFEAVARLLERLCAEAPLFLL